MRLRSFCALALVLAACRAPTRSTLADLDDSYLEDDARRLATEQACPSIEHPRFWRVEKDDQTSHLFGTYHVGVGVDRLPAIVERALTSARVIVVETLDDDDEEPSASEPERPLSIEIGPAAWSRLIALIGPVYAAAADELSPLQAILVLTTMYMDTTHFLDSEIEQGARSRGQPVVALETAAEVMPLARRWLSAHALRALLMASRGRRELRDATLRDLADYCSGREGGDRAAMAGKPASRRGRERVPHEVLGGRNLAWLTRLEPELVEGNAFVAVGAAHLEGDGSIVDLLRDRGYHVSRVE